MLDDKEFKSKSKYGLIFIQMCINFYRIYMAWELKEKTIIY